VTEIAEPAETRAEEDSGGGQPGQIIPLWAPVASGALVMAVGVLVGLRGLHLTVMPWGRAYWEVTYQSGFIRRALAGSIFQALYRDLPFTRQSLLVVEISIVTVLAFLVALAIWLSILVYRSPSRSHALSIVLISLPIIGSSLMPTLVFDTGYLDAFLLLIALACVALLASGRLWLAVAIAAAAPLAHELFFYLWLPIILFGLHALTRGRRARPIRHVLPTLLLPCATTVAVTFFSSAAAARAEVNHHVAGPASYKAGLLTMQFGQSLSYSLTRMQHFQTKYWWPAEPVDIVYFCWPAILAVVIYSVWRWHLLDGWARSALVMSLIGPWAMLATAWDLSRLVLMANAMALIIIYGIETRLVGTALPRVGPGWIATFVGLSVFAVSLPFVYGFFDGASRYSNGPLRFDLARWLHPLMTSLMHLNYHPLA
jgi:hypothetical protein